MNIQHLAEVHTHFAASFDDAGGSGFRFLMHLQGQCKLSNVVMEIIGGCAVAVGSIGIFTKSS